MQRIFLICGEKSGDKIAAELIDHVQSTQAFEWIGMGGDACHKAGLQCVERYEAYAVMGITEMLSHLPALLKLKKRLIKALKNYQPDLLIVVDYPGMNLPMAKVAHQLNIPVVYFIPPKVWASRPKRIELLKKYVQHIITIFPFEETFFRGHHIQTTYWQHPLVKKILNQFPELKSAPDLTPLPKNIQIALLPGSRSNEIKRMLPLMLETAGQLKQQHPNLNFILLRAGNITLEHETIPQWIEIIAPEKHSLALRRTHLAMVTSGTATIELAVHNIPMVATYRVNKLSEIIAKCFLQLNLKYYTLVNIMANQAVIPELLQAQANTKRLGEAMTQLIENNHTYQAQKVGLFSITQQFNTSSPLKVQDVILGLLKR